jgi:hypothetical protein
MTQHGPSLLPSLTLLCSQRFASGQNDSVLQAFPHNFRMVAGNPDLRTYNASDLAQQAIQMTCIEGTQADPKAHLPPTNCPWGLRAEITFPGCWDGVNLDSPDHKSHVSYPVNMPDNGPCPDSHPVHIPTLHMEVLWSVDDFKDRWYGDSQPFVFSDG